jgi:hypothetical protein
MHTPVLFSALVWDIWRTQRRTEDEVSSCTAPLAVHTVRVLSMVFSITAVVPCHKASTGLWAEVDTLGTVVIHPLPSKTYQRPPPITHTLPGTLVAGFLERGIGAAAHVCTEHSRTVGGTSCRIPWNVGSTAAQVTCGPLHLHTRISVCLCVG